MDVVSSLYLASFAGAGLFFGSGFFFGKSRRQEPSTDTSPSKNAEDVEKTAEKVVFEAEQSLAKIENELTQTKVQLDKEREAKMRAEQQVQELQTKIRLSSPPPLPASQEAKQLRAQLIALEAKTKAQEAELNLQQKEIERLSVQQISMNSDEGKTNVNKQTLPIVPAMVTAEEETASATLEQQLAFLTNQPNCQAAVIADSQGLLIAAAGMQSECFDALGAVSGLVLEVVQKAQDYLPLAKVHCFEIADTAQLGIRSRIVEIDEDAFVVTTLGKIQPQSAEDIEMVAARLPSIVNRFI